MIEKIVNKLNLNNKKVFYIALVVFFLTLIPLVIISFYDFPSADDFGYGFNTHTLLMEEGFFGLFKGMWLTVKDSYITWQGTFSAIAIMSLQPAALFGESFYFLGPLILYTVFIVSIFSLVKEICQDYLSVDKYISYIISILFCTICIQTLPSLVQGFYWWNGASYYTLFFSLELLQIRNILKFLKTGKNRNLIISIIIAIFIGGGNLVTVLNDLILMFFLLIYLFKTNHKEKYKILILFLCLGGSFAINVLAPGNAIRQEMCDKSSAFSAVITSFSMSSKYLRNWLNFYNISYIIAIVYLLRTYTKNKNLKFKYPLLITLFVFCVLSALFTPSLFAQSFEGPERLLNIVYYTFIIGIIIVAYYWLGWFKSSEKINNKKRVLTPTLFILFAFVNCIWVYGLRYDLSSYIAFSSLVRGEAKTYKEEMQNRYEIFKDDTIKEVVLKPLTVHPKAIYFDDLWANKDHFANKALSNYYNKEYIIVKYN